jgi:HD superfamily phosphohydrolase
MRRNPKIWHEVRCAIHGFIRYNSLERDLIDSAPVQRLKHIHQLAMTYQVYPGATHRRFEHSLGVMDLAGRAFESVMRPEKLQYGGQKLQEAVDRSQRDYWLQVLRLAALLHDVGHLPFSHAAEKELLPPGWSHEHLTRNLIMDSEITDILKKHRPRYEPEDIVKLALEPDEQPKTELTSWEAILNEIVTGPTFGVDRMDYLLRDSHHAGVGYGRFDPLRLLDSLVIVIPPQSQADAPTGTGSETPLADATTSRMPSHQTDEWLTLGIQDGGIQGAEALLLARYFMWAQVYLHHVRRAYDLHLKDFMLQWLEGKYPTESAKHLQMTDNRVLTAIDDAAADPDKPGHETARRIVQRDHFRLAHRLKQVDVRRRHGGQPDAPELIAAALRTEFGSEAVTVDCIPPKQGKKEVLVLLDNEQVISGLAESDVLDNIPPIWCAYVFCSKEILPTVQNFLNANKSKLLQTAAPVEETE